MTGPSVFSDFSSKMVEIENFFVFVILLAKIRSLEICSNITSASNNINWPTTSSNNQTLSKPICLDDNREFVYRKCTNGQWDPEPSCSYIQQEKPPQCPGRYTEKDTFCFFITKRTTFPPKCPSAVVLPFNVYKKIIPSNIPMWVPAKRTNTNGLDYIRWIEPSWQYKTEVYNYTFSKPVSAKNCLIYLNLTYHAVSCNEQYKGVCAYSKVGYTNTNQGVCESAFECLQNDLVKPSTCYCLAHTMQDRTAEFIKPFQNHIYTVLTNKTCAIALQKNPDGKYMWTYTQKEVDYTYWSPNVIFDDNHIYGAATPEGWILTERPLTCFIFEKAISNLKPSLQLQFVDSRNSFNLTVKNPQRLKSLMYCFTDADPLHLIYVYRIFLIEQNKSDVIFYEFGPRSYSGTYWCEAFMYNNGTIVKSEEVFVTHNGLEFVGIFQMKYSDEMNPLSVDIVNLIQNTLFLHLNFSSIMKTYYQPRIMKIIDVDEANQKIKFNVHFSVTTNNTHEDLEYILKDEITEVLDSLNMEKLVLVDFLSPEFCPSTFDLLTWPKSTLGSVVSPKEFCFDSDGNQVTRLCDGDFIMGASWGDFYRDCKIFEYSPITNSLLQASTNYTVLQSVQNIYNISVHYQDFQPLDVYLVGILYSQLLESPTSEIFVPTINNLLKIDTDILRESQLKLRATDKLLNFIDNVENSTTTQITPDKFVFISMKTEELSGVAIISTDDGFSVKILTGDVTSDNVTKIKNLESAVWLSPTLRNEFPPNETITFSVYFNNAFFQESETRKTTIIFGLIQPKNYEFFNGPVNILHKTAAYPFAQPLCAYWSYSRTLQGEWKPHGQPQSLPPFLMCDFWQPDNFAIIGKLEEMNVTDSLEQLLTSDSTPETVIQLSQISEQHQVFQTVDVEYVAQILEKVSTEDVDLEHLTKIVSNLQKVKPEILLESQVNEGATDRILHNVDIIALGGRNYDTIQTMSDNFIILVVNYKKNFNGLVLVNTVFSPQIQILTNNLSLEEITQDKNFDSAVVLSEGLKTQIIEGSKLVFTVFIRDVLFNEITKKELVGKIFGVVIPDVTNYSGPISVLYKTDVMKQEQMCAHWHYDNSQKVKGTWKEDTRSKNFSNYVQCDFFHTTHFTYLIKEKTIVSNSSECFDLLDLLSSVNCVISLASLVCIVLTAIFFEQWRQNTGNQIILNYTFAIVLQITAFYVSTSVENLLEHNLMCTIIGAILHYSTVSQFCWMLVIALLQFRRFVNVLEGPPKSVLLKACVCGWIVSLIPVLCICLVDKNNYVKNKAGFCYPSDLGLYLGVWLPLGLIIFVNFIIFSITLYNVVHKKTERFNGCHESLYQWRLAIMLFFLLGFTWTFGFLAQLDFGLIFEYLFCMTATLQGFILFLFFIVFNANTRYMYVKSISNFCKKKFK